MRTELSKGRPDKEIGRPIMAGRTCSDHTTAPTGSDVPLAANVTDMQISNQSGSKLAWEKQTSLSSWSDMMLLCSMFSVSFLCLKGVSQNKHAV